MIVYAVYDIESTKAGDKRRRLLVKKLEQMGLYRIQKSVFAGNINKNQIDELVVYFEKIVDNALKKEERDAIEDKFYIFPVSKDDFDNVRIVGKSFDKKLVSDEIRNISL